jgi:hypothetical protein
MSRKVEQLNLYNSVDTANRLQVSAGDATMAVLHYENAGVLKPVMVKHLAVISEDGASHQVLDVALRLHELNLDIQNLGAASGQALTDLGTALNDEINRATTAEAANSQAITDEKDRAEAAEAVLQGQIDAEVIAARDAEAANLAAIQAEEARALAAENANLLAIQAEEGRALAAEAANLQAINDETARAVAAEGGLQTSINLETSRATAAEAANAQAIIDETSRAQGVEGGLQTALDAEVARATGVEAGLQSSIDNIISNVDPAALDSLSEIVSAFQTADSDLNNTITTLSTGLDTRLTIVEQVLQTFFDVADLSTL